MTPAARGRTPVMQEAARTASIPERPRGTGDQAWICGEILIDMHINQRRCLNGTDEPGKFLG
jgi:hypothetical protein